MLGTKHNQTSFLFFDLTRSQLPLFLPPQQLDNQPIFTTTSSTTTTHDSSPSLLNYLLPSLLLPFLPSDFPLAFLGSHPGHGPLSLPHFLSFSRNLPTRPSSTLRETNEQKKRYKKRKHHVRTTATATL